MSFTKVAPAGIGTEPGDGITIGDSFLHTTGIDIGHNTGIGVTIRKHGDATFTGIITASAFFGDGSGLEGVSSSGIGTPLSDDDTSELNKVYYVNQELSIGSTVTVNHPDSAVASYTHYQDLVVKDNADFIVADGDTFIPDVLGIRTSTSTASAATGGRIRAGTITNAGANGAPNFPNGLTGTAGTFTTATITGNLGVGGVLTYEDVTNIDSVGVITARSGIRIAAGSTVGPISGIITYFGDGSQLTGIDSTALSFGGSVKIQANASGTIHSGMTTATGGVSIPASTTIGLDLGDGTNKAQLAMQSGVANRIALRTTYSTFGDNNPFIIYQPSSAGVQNDALVVHASGIVMKPKTPAFHVSRQGGNVSANNIVVFDAVFYDNGTNYNNSNGRFTAPVTGIYFFSAWHFTGSTSAFKLYKNGSQYGEYAWDDTGGCATWVMPMNSGQYAQIYTHSYTWRGSASYHNGFCGYLIG